MPNLPYNNTAAVAASTPFGGVSITIGANTYRALNWKPKKNSRKIRRNDTNGDQAEFMIRAEPTTQSGLNLQRALASTGVPAMGAEFTGPDGLTYLVTGTEEGKQEGEYWMIDIDYESKSLPTD